MRETLTNLSREMPRPSAKRPRVLLSLVGVVAFGLAVFHVAHRIMHSAEFVWQDLLLIGGFASFAFYALDPDVAGEWTDKLLRIKDK